VSKIRANCGIGYLGNSPSDREEFHDMDDDAAMDAFLAMDEDSEVSAH
jgi:hypothetical protein